MDEKFNFGAPRRPQKPNLLPSENGYSNLMKGITLRLLFLIRRNVCGNRNYLQKDECGTEGVNFRPSAFDFRADGCHHIVGRIRRFIRA